MKTKKRLSGTTWIVPLKVKRISHKPHVTSTEWHHTWLPIWSRFLCPHLFYTADWYSGSCLNTLVGKMCICLQPSVLCPLHCSSSVLLPCHPELFRFCRALQSRFCSACAKRDWTAKLSLREKYIEIKTLISSLYSFLLVLQWTKALRLDRRTLAVRSRWRDPPPAAFQRVFSYL